MFPIPSPLPMTQVWGCSAPLTEIRCACAGRGERGGAPAGTHGDSRLRQHPFIIIVTN